MLEKDQLLLELTKAKGEVKLFLNLKEKKYIEHKYKVNNKMNREIEEISIIRGKLNEE